MHIRGYNFYNKRRIIVDTFLNVLNVLYTIVEPFNVNALRYFTSCIVSHEIMQKVSENVFQISEISDRENVLAEFEKMFRIFMYLRSIWKL